MKAGQMETNREQTPTQCPLTRQWRRGRLLLSAGSGPSLPRVGWEKDLGLRTSALRAPAECAELPLQELGLLCKACTGPPWAAGGARVRGLIQVKGQKGLGTG